MPPPPPANIRDVFRETRAAIQSVLNPYKLTIKSGGTRDLELDLANTPVDPATGFWGNPSQMSSKPLRWILQIEESSNPLSALPSTDANGALFAGSNTPGYFNNRDATCVAAVFRILAAVRPAGQPDFEFPGWEWLLVLGFDKPLPAGTSGDPLTNFNPAAGTIDYGTGGVRKPYNLSLIAMVTAPPGTPMYPATGASKLSINYSDATAAIAQLILSGPVGGSVYDGAVPADLQQLGAQFGAILAAGPSPVPTSVAPNPSLLGISASTYRQIDAALAAGKRHIIFYGPPGTGKTTLAEYVARELSPDPSLADAYTMLTASASWSSQDLIGGYQPLGAGQMGFIPGVLLRNFDRPFVIDELNRCPIDKVIGPLFSVLSGQTTTLPYRVDVTDPDSDFFAILPVKPPSLKGHEFAPDPHWRLVCTLNTIDKTQLGQISYALSRRFAWIKVGVPEDLEDFVEDWCLREGFITTKPTTGMNPVGAMWKAINATRELGAAPIIDFLRAARQMDPAFDLFASPNAQEQEILLDALRMYILPLMDGISLYEAEALSKQITVAWSLPSSLADALSRDFNDMAT